MSFRAPAMDLFGCPKRNDKIVGSDRGILDQPDDIKSAFKAPPTPTRDADCTKPCNIVLRRPKDRHVASTGRALTTKEAIAAAKSQGSQKTSAPVISKWWESQIGKTRATAPAEVSSASDPVEWEDFLETRVMEDWQESRSVDIDSSPETSKIDGVRDTLAPARTKPVSEPQATGTPSIPIVVEAWQETRCMDPDASQEETRIDSARTTASAEPLPVFGPHTLETILQEPLELEEEHAFRDIDADPTAGIPIPSIESARLREHRALMRRISSAFTRDGVAIDGAAQDFLSL